MTRPEQPLPYPGDAAPAVDTSPMLPAATAPVGAPVDPGQPQPFPGELRSLTAGLALAPVPLGVYPYRQEYRDTLDRPMSGRVTITVTGRRDGVVVDLVDGVLDVSLPPNTYELYAQLRTVDGDRAVRQTDLTLPQEPPSV